MLTDATATHRDAGISWSGRTKCSPNDDDCIVTMNDIFIWLVGSFIICLVLALYLDNIIPNPYGMRKPAFYFLYPGYQIRKGGSKVQALPLCAFWESFELARNH